MRDIDTDIKYLIVSPRTFSVSYLQDEALIPRDILPQFMLGVCFERMPEDTLFSTDRKLTVATIQARAEIGHPLKILDDNGRYTEMN